MGGAFRTIGGTSAGVYYRHGDHLGSTSVISDANGLKIPGSEVQYAPFGELRSGELSALTDFGYTGQRLDRSTGGLMYYGAWYYLPGLRRFISADSVVPGSGTPQGFNRYAYTSNSPINYRDPSGHEPEKWTEEWWVWRYYELELWRYEDPGHDIGSLQEPIEDTETTFGVELTDSTEWNIGLVQNVRWAFTLTGIALAGESLSSFDFEEVSTVFKSYFEGLEITPVAGEVDCAGRRYIGGCTTTDGMHIYFSVGSNQLTRVLIHELGHSVLNQFGRLDAEGIMDDYDAQAGTDITNSCYAVRRTG